MNHATTYHFGNHKNAQRKTAATVEQATLSVQQMDGAPTECTGNRQGQTQICTDSYACNGFLKTTFLPKLKTAQSLQASQSLSSLERDYYLIFCIDGLSLNMKNNRTSPSISDTFIPYLFAFNIAEGNSLVM